MIKKAKDEEGLGGNRLIEEEECEKGAGSYGILNMFLIHGDLRPSISFSSRSFRFFTHLIYSMLTFH